MVQTKSTIIVYKVSDLYSRGYFWKLYLWLKIANNGQKSPKKQLDMAFPKQNKNLTSVGFNPATFESQNADSTNWTIEPSLWWTKQMYINYCWWSITIFSFEHHDVYIEVISYLLKWWRFHSRFFKRINLKKLWMFFIDSFTWISMN